MFHVWGEVGSTVFANVVASVPSYFLTRNWVWGKTGRSHLVKEIIPFWTMSALGIAFSIIGAAAAKHLGTRLGLSHFEQTLLVEAANVTSFAVFWVANDKTVRRRNGQTPVIVSNSGIEQILSKINLTGSYALFPTVYGHPLYVLTCPNANGPRQTGSDPVLQTTQELMEL